MQTGQRIARTTSYSVQQQTQWRNRHLCVLPSCAGEAAKPGVLGHVGIVTVRLVGEQGRRVGANEWHHDGGQRSEQWPSRAGREKRGGRRGLEGGVSGRSYCTWCGRRKPMRRWVLILNGICLPTRNKVLLQVLLSVFFPLRGPLNAAIKGQNGSIMESTTIVSFPRER